MMHRDRGQLSLADGLIEGSAGRNARLDRIDNLLDWSPIEALVSDIYSSPTGRPSVLPLCMVKALLL